MIKIETDVELDMDVLGLIDPDVTINYVADGETDFEGQAYSSEKGDRYPGMQESALYFPV